MNYWTCLWEWLSTYSFMNVTGPCVRVFSFHINLFSVFLWNEICSTNSCTMGDMCYFSLARKIAVSSSHINIHNCHPHFSHIFTYAHIFYLDSLPQFGEEKNQTNNLPLLVALQPKDLCEWNYNEKWRRKTITQTSYIFFSKLNWTEIFFIFIISIS